MGSGWIMQFGTINFNNMAEIQKIKEGMTGQQVADLLDSNFNALNKEIGSGGGGITVDDSLSDSSTNPVQNKVIKAELDKKAAKTDVNTAINKVKSELNSDIEGNSSDISDLQSSVGTLLKFPIPIGATEVLFSYYNDEYCINQSYPLFSCIIFSIGGILPEMDKEEMQIVSPVINIMPLPTYGGADLYLSPGTGNDLLDGLRLEELYANYDELCTKYPMWIRRVENLGSDSSGLEIRQYEVRYTNPWVVNGEGGMIGKGNEVNLWNDASYGYQKILINTGTHGDEKSPCWGTMLAIKDIVESSESWAMFIKSSFIIKVCPTLNPYGFQNRTLANYNGVNINRDIAALTQPESQAWKAWVDANTDAKAYLDMHGVDFYHPFFEIAKSNTDELKKLYGGLAAKFAAAFLENWSSYLGNSDYPRPYTVISTYNGTTMEYIASIGIKGFTVETPCDIVSNQYNPAPNYFKNYSKSNKITKDMLINLIMFLGKLS